jgi:hypothetical protein
MKAILWAIFLAILINPSAACGQTGFGISVRPSWVKPVSYSKSISDTTNVSGGYYYLLFDQQINVERQEVYVEIAIKVTSDKGLSFASEINESYDPAFQKLNFNSLYVLRGNSKIDKLVRRNFEVIRREENLSRAMYDGSLSVINNLKDIKTGDVVCFSFTVAGFNPIVNGHFSRSFYLNRGAATGKVSVRLLASPTRKLIFKWVGDEVPLRETKEGGLASFYLEKENVGSVKYEDRVPPWYNYYNVLQVTDFSDWNEMTTWASTLFKKPGEYSFSLRHFIDSLRSIPDDEGKTIAAIRTIQDKVRYLSLSNGLNGYKPHSPSEVFSNKYGDCKDKSFLLSQVLSELGVESHPVLVHSDGGKSLNEKLPAPGDFDHCIVQFKVNDSLYYVDPTISFQRGKLSRLYTPNYYFGVVADLKQPGLITIPTPKENGSLIRVREEFEVGGVTESVRLKVTTVYSGREADIMRDQQSTSSISELNQSYLDFYANDYPDVKMVKSVTFKDNPAKNEMTVEEEYNLPDFWEYDSKVSQYKANATASVVASYLTRPSTKSRHMPFYLRYPLDIEETMIFTLPEEYNIEGLDAHIHGPGFSFTGTSGYAEHAVRLKYSFYHSSSFVNAVDTREYLDKIDEVYDNIGYQFTDHQTQVTGVRGTDTNVLLTFTGAILIICFFVSRRLYLYDPEPENYSGGYHEFNAVLLIAIVGLSITPIRILISMADGTFFHDTVGVFSNPKSNLPLTIYVIVERLLNLVLLALAILSFMLAWNRRTSAPLFVTIFYAANFIGLAVMMLMGGIFFEIHPEPTAMKNLVLAILLAAIFIPYFRLSQRAKGTFRSRLRF